VDDKDNLTGGLMTMLLLERLNVPLDRDVISCRSGRGGQLELRRAVMVNQHYPEIESEYCLAEGGGAVGSAASRNARPSRRSRDPARHQAGGAWHLQPRIDSTSSRTRSSTWLGRSRRSASGGPDPLQRNGGDASRLASIAAPEKATHRDVLSTDPRLRAAWTRGCSNEPLHSSMLRASVSPDIFTGGYRLTSSRLRRRRRSTSRCPTKIRSSSSSRSEDRQRPAVDVHFTAQNVRRHPHSTRASTRAYKVPRRRQVDLQHDHAADDEHRRDHWRSSARGACSASASARRSTWKTARRASCTAIRAPPRASYTASCAQLQSRGSGRREVMTWSARLTLLFEGLALLLTGFAPPLQVQQPQPDWRAIVDAIMALAV
jgi:hypothetical protein